jgi:hypothetical protein
MEAGLETSSLAPLCFHPCNSMVQHRINLAAAPSVNRLPCVVILYIDLNDVRPTPLISNLQLMGRANAVLRQIHCSQTSA